MSMEYKLDRIIIIDLLYLGDLLFATPFIRNLRQNLPESRIDMVVNSNFFSIIEDSPYLDNVYSYNKEWNTRESINFTKKLRKNHYTLGINIHGNWRTAFLLKDIKPDYSVGYGGRGRGIFLDQVIERPADLHMVNTYLKLLEDNGYTVKDKNTEIGINPASLKKMRGFLRENGYRGKRKVIGLNTGGSWPTKRWPVEKFAKLADRLIAEYNCNIIFLGSKGDLSRIDKIISLMNNRPLVAAGETNLKELAVLESMCDLVISNDSGPVHVAAAAGTPTITIFGPSDEKKYRPLGDKHEIVINELDCRPCGEHKCPLGHHRCMEDIGVDDVLKIADKMGCL